MTCVWSSGAASLYSGGDVGVDLSVTESLADYLHGNKKRARAHAACREGASLNIFSSTAQTSGQAKSFCVRLTFSLNCRTRNKDRERAFSPTTRPLLYLATVGERGDEGGGFSGGKPADHSSLRVAAPEGRNLLVQKLPLGAERCVLRRHLISKLIDLSYSIQLEQNTKITFTKRLHEKSMALSIVTNATCQTILHERRRRANWLEHRNASASAVCSSLWGETLSSPVTFDLCCTVHQDRRP